MEVVEESIKLKIEIEKIKHQFLQLLCSFDDPQPASLSDAQSYLKHLYEWKKNKASNNNRSIFCKNSHSISHSHPNTTYIESKHTLSDKTSKLDTKDSKKTNDCIENTSICDKTYLQNVSNKENNQLNILLPESTLSWDTFMEMSILPRDSVLHDCDSFTQDDNNVFESTVSFPINSTTLKIDENRNSDGFTILQKLRNESNVVPLNRHNSILDKAYHPYKRPLPNRVSTLFKNRLCSNRRIDSYSSSEEINSLNENSLNFRKGLMSALNTCQFESFYSSTEKDSHKYPKKSLKKQKAVSCLHSCLDSTFSVPSLLSCYNVDSDRNLKTELTLCKNLPEIKKTMDTTKKSSMDFLCLPFLSS